MTHPSLTLLLITGNAGATLARCLASGKFADEIVVLDCGSTDDTIAIARTAGAKISSTPDFPGYAAQKQRALELAACDWVMAIDGDEWIEPPLAEEILATIANPGPHLAFHIPAGRGSVAGAFVTAIGAPTASSVFIAAPAPVTPAIACMTGSSSGDRSAG